jgi:cell division septum initiation protein DivIVA
VTNLYKEADYDELLVENQDLLKKREELKKTITTLKTCLNEINKVSGKLL